MSVTAVIKKNSYFDSVSLMSISTKANGLDGVEQAFVAMGTEMNKGVLQNLGLLTPELAEAGNGDLMIVVVPSAGAEAGRSFRRSRNCSPARRPAAAARKSPTAPSRPRRRRTRAQTLRSSQSTAPTPDARPGRHWKTA